MANENETQSEAQGGAAAVLNILKTNPKALYVVGGAVVAVILLLTLRGGDGEIAQVRTNVSVGQTVTVRNPNIGDTLLVAVPGKLGSADTGDEENICVVKPGATALLEEETVANTISFVKVAIQDGECQGKSGWTPKVNISAK
ncbi:hypothetical protein [Methylococcus sp. EFPC2]|uniref:hypothetical protein n=1 Tax=Methylococcus sp. EFPC2 TaxID=2812648 RepID=UPI001967AC3E|nr:hypothetical protein [Methylococcus sp. EFPC2]QSA98739.1 hypothetical protein JWZ97_08130 [Methylococcus sp. EFPC2]